MKTKYILITPVHNEEEYIEAVLKSVIAQTIRPDKWVIANDASTDETENIIKRFTDRYDFIEIHSPQIDNPVSYYGRRTQVFLSGYKKVEKLEYDYVASLDADLTMEPDYYESILREFDRNPRLGIATGVYLDKVGGCLRKIVRDNISTPGGLQMFRRECYEDVGGYIPLKYGSDDALADIIARMNGWETRSFPRYPAIHHRPVGTRGGTHILIARFRQGLAEYNIGTHPLFMLAKSARRVFLEKPYLFGSTARFLGFWSGYLHNIKREGPTDAIAFFQKEQIGRLWECIRISKNK
ncbi:MAG: glycosyltransferase family 2 protein [Desulfosporosinus sp.]|nr:glycosyltransferase family 2 protein [Desulfosporosinus sp.]